jgi:hypothetical protein
MISMIRTDRTGTLFEKSGDKPHNKTRDYDITQWFKRAG